MTDYFNSAISGIQNATTSAVDRKVTKNVATLNYDDKTKGFNYKTESNKTCKIVIQCENAKTLLNAMKGTINTVSEAHKQELNSIIQNIKSSVNDLNADNIDQYIKNLKKYEDTYKAKLTAKQAELKKAINPTTAIPVEVFVKNVEGRHDGTIRSYNVYNKTVTVDYTNDKGAKETLYDIEIKKLCIEGAGCQIQVGGGESMTRNEHGNTNYGGKYKVICE